ncbi:NAD(P)/FAD-dependent oxidoreductase [Chitinophaga pinensis]|uniref:NAD(P)/FAD-dependent oxidoreductase n=1 Tax=Chitinophaga pinensis TaxID=79329 RepID=UPI001C996D6B|nr:FAD-dependent oxidoreductase [Chitinophaga pinensis]
MAIGQPSGRLYKRAKRSREIWQSICEEAGIWHDPTGSLHLAYHEDELQAIREYVSANAAERDCTLLTPAEALEKSPAINPDGLLGALWSPDEMIVEAREAIGQVAAFLEKKYNIRFHWHTAIIKSAIPPSVRVINSGKPTGSMYAAA